MPWFRVDDSFHSHPKVLATPPAALGLWVVAGAWSSAHLTDGFIPDNVLPWLLPDSGKLADALVTSGLWKRRKGGYQFHDWYARNPSRKAVENQRKTNNARQRRWQDAQRNAVTDNVSNGVTNSAPTRPSPTNGSVVTNGAGQPWARGPNNRYRPDDNAATRHPSSRSVAEAIADATRRDP